MQADKDGDGLLLRCDAVRALCCLMGLDQELAEDVLAGRPEDNLSLAGVVDALEGCEGGYQRWWPSLLHRKVLAELFQHIDTNNSGAQQRETQS